MNQSNTFLSVIVLCLITSEITFAQKSVDEAVEAKVNEAEAVLQIREQEFKRMQALHRERAVSAGELAKAARSLAEARVELASLRTDRDNLIDALQELVKLSQQELQRMEQLVSNGLADASNLARAKEQLLHTKTRLVEAESHRKPKKIEKADQERIKSLRLQRRSVLRQLVEVVEAQNREGAVPLETVLKANLNLLDAELAVVETPEQRKKIQEKMIQVMKVLEDAAERKFKNGLATQAEYLAAKAARLNLEIRMLRSIK